MSIRGTSLTSGPVTAGYEEKPYRRHGDPGWRPGHPDYAEPVSRIPSDPGNQHRMEAKAGRMKVFTEARERDVPLSVKDAGALVGIAYKTAWAYERERLDALREEKQQQGDSDG